jgi:predicted XRE-type DNA-binding protein
MRDQDPRRGRAPRSLRREVSGSGVRVARVREAEEARITPSSGNVFRDIAFPAAEAEHLLIRSDLMIAIRSLIAERGFTQARAARLFGVTQPRVSDLVRGRVELFTIDSLVEMLARAGVGVSVRLERRRGRG